MENIREFQAYGYFFLTAFLAITLYAYFFIFIRAKKLAEETMKSTQN